MAVIFVGMLKNFSDRICYLELFLALLGTEILSVSQTIIFFCFLILLAKLKCHLCSLTWYFSHFHPILTAIIFFEKKFLSNKRPRRNRKEMLFSFWSLWATWYFIHLEWRQRILLSTFFTILFCVLRKSLHFIEST